MQLRARIGMTLLAAAVIGGLALGLIPRAVPVETVAAARGPLVVTVEEQRVRVIADFVSPRAEWQRVGDGYRVEARFVVWEGADILQVPASALFRHNHGWAVFVVDDGRARLRPIETGQRNGLQVQVLSGLDAGMHVIAHPDDKIADDTRVKPR